MEERHRIAVFIDFDNIEIGVKNTLSRNFDVSVVLETLKERGEVLTKIAYADWTRHGEMSRTMSQHGVQMVQRHPGPRGDKNGADINLALDALEMALTKPHIDAFAIVSGDSDFISLVEKLKQYNKTVYIVGGRAFTSNILQKNCREFISYESLITPAVSAVRRPAQGPHRGIQRPPVRSRQSLPLSHVTPLVYRALEVLSRREVVPQLGLFKSTMQQLDSSFTERDYGASSFRHFVEMLEKEHMIVLHKDRGHYIVEMPQAEQTPVVSEPALDKEDSLPILHKALKVIDENDLWGQLDFEAVKQYVLRLEPDFDESRYGFVQFPELLNYAQDLGLVRLEPDADSVIRVLRGTEFSHARSPVRSNASFANIRETLPGETRSQLPIESSVLGYAPDNAVPLATATTSETPADGAVVDNRKPVHPRRVYRRHPRPRTPRPRKPTAPAES
ncbi:MAG: hypothetical protein A3F68_13175 [Acidobacteria bacterium RIFCSPLOWO2_12_FULL_54_10]|nr:MAG: hypothetical protein A3F68_13175 [Acidobacteria bacterium RIFCSPLOWO2_12_FULL_54_10]